MTDRPVDLDVHRGMAAQKATELRRMLHEVEEDQRALRERQTEFETILAAAPARDWAEAAIKIRYVLKLYASVSEARDPRHQALIASLLSDLDRLGA